jgi:ATP-dependent Clp protease protease subunit
MTSVPPFTPPRPRPAQQQLQQPPRPRPKAISFIGEINAASVSKIIAQLNQQVIEGHREIHIALSTTGGNVMDGIFLYNQLRALPVKLIAYNIGSVMSIGVLCFSAADERYCSRHATFMVHPTSISPAANSSPQLLAHLSESLIQDEERTDAILKERVKFPEGFLEGRRAQAILITPEQAKEYGLVHEIKEYKVPDGHDPWML